MAEATCLTGFFFVISDCSFFAVLRLEIKVKPSSSPHEEATGVEAEEIETTPLGFEGNSKAASPLSTGS